MKSESWCWMDTAHIETGPTENVIKPIQTLNPIGGMIDENYNRHPTERTVRLYAKCSHDMRFRLWCLEGCGCGCGCGRGSGIWFWFLLPLFLMIFCNTGNYSHNPELLCSLFRSSVSFKKFAIVTVRLLLKRS